MRGFLSTCFVMLVVMATSPSHAVCDDGTCLELQPGNNLVSFSSLPVDASISSVFGGLASSIVLIRSEGVVAHRLSNGTHAGNLVTIERNRGYWVTLDAPSAKTLPLSGESTDPDIRFNLHSGSNLISFPCAVPLPVTEAFTPESIDSIENIVGQGVIAQKIGKNWVGSLTTLEPGKGYWLKVKDDLPNFYFQCPGSDATQTYVYGCKDPVALNFNEDATVDDQSCTYAVSKLWNYPSSDNEAFYILNNVRIDGKTLANDAFIGAFEGDSCVGFGHPIGDFTTVPVRGVSPGEIIVFKELHPEGVGAELQTLPSPVVKDSGVVLGGCGISTASNYFLDAQMGIGNCRVVDGCDQETPGTPCDDGSECTIDDACNADGLCRGVFMGCPADSPCFATECLFTGECALWWTDGPCDDGDACTLDDGCSEGSCSGQALSCPDGESCVDGSCVASEPEPSPDTWAVDVSEPDDAWSEPVEEVIETEDTPVEPDTPKDPEDSHNAPDLEIPFDAGNPDTGALDSAPSANPDTGSSSSPEETTPVPPASGCACESAPSGGNQLIMLLFLASFVAIRRRRFHRFSG